VELFNKSIDIIIENQHESGAYIASPAFPTYNYSWFRDGSYIAYSMDRVKNHDSSSRFHHWCADVIIHQKEKIEKLISKKNNGKPIKSEEYLTARYTVEGKSTGDDWTDFQLDGYGTWLWSLKEHIELTKNDGILIQIRPSIELIVNYLITFWKTPCYDYWEEHLDAIHTSTLVAIIAGLEASLNFELSLRESTISETITKIRDFIDTNIVHPDGYYRKLIFPGKSTDSESISNLVDASQISLSVPFEVYSIDNEIFQSTINKIESDLYRPNGGVYRYLKDTFYGGGEWILLSAWLGWYWCKNGQFDKAKNVRNFIESQTDNNLNLPEQVSSNLLDPSFYKPWNEKWGPNANPLLWSHAMYLILCEELKVYEQ
jgi:GH15 family glucan-1,4-alpha-glucosidase